ncbi:hypothetical protein GLOIN_2v1881038 [Rhizophagus clarus]|uniref:Ion transport domain-containing protein n=1 Tax=Rhizophagus clarus TaxID=94130 RepID=A0A8H3QG68_9GLOM|nr:hypothetical protein GLOIN_2v1881038 [Rhizophagus clarus]
MEDEKETVIEIDQTTQQHIEETKDDNPIQPHNRKKIDKFVSYDMSEDEIFAAAYILKVVSEFHKEYGMQKQLLISMEALCSVLNRDGEYKINIYSMKTSKHILSYINKNYYPIKFITLKNDSERLILIKDNCNNNNNTDGKNLQKIIDSFNTKSYIDTIGNPDDIILTESNKKLYIDKKYHHICRTDWLKKDEFEQLLNKTTTIYYGDIYTSTIFETIRKMLSRIISIDKFPENYVIEPDKLFRFNLEKVETWNEIEIKVKGFTKDNNDWKETQNNCVSSTVSELFKDSLPPPNFEFFKSYSEYHHLVEGIMNDPKDSLEFATKLLEIEIEREKENGAKYIKFMGQIRTKIFDMIIKSIEMTNSQQLPAIRQYMNIINSKLPQLCDNRYSSLVMKYILHTSILLDNSCASFKNSKNISLYAYTKELHIKRTSKAFLGVLPIIYKFLSQKSREDLNEIIYKPKSPWNTFIDNQKSILFCNIDSNNYYQWWNFAAIIDFKWKTFGKMYYFLIWIFYTIFLICFVLASTLSFSNPHRKILYIFSILLGFVHLSFEVRQFLWERSHYIKDLWNLFVFPSYGKYFAIIIGVAKDVFPFLVVLFFILFGFGLAFFILLKPTKDFSLDQPTINDDKNNPWNLAIRYSSINSDGSISSNPTLIQTPDSNSNMFSWFPTSLLAMYLFLTGDSGSFSLWTYREDPMMTFLIFLFSFFTVVYLMNLFIGLLNMSIEDYNKYEEFLLSKARILRDIELYHKLPFQRYKKEWFPDMIYYDIPVDKVRDLINAIDNKRTVFTFLPFISERLRKLIDVPAPIKQVEVELKELK